ncbi:MAG: hypothetical protein WB777_07545 [Mycobacterium sp.]
MTDTTGAAAEQSSSPEHRPSRLNKALAWVGIVAGGVFIVGAIFLSGFFLNWSEHMHMNMGHTAMAHESKDCCADMKPGDMKHDDMKHEGHMMQPGAMTGPGMMGPQPGH